MKDLQIRHPRDVAAEKVREHIADQKHREIVINDRRRARIGPDNDPRGEDEVGDPTERIYDAILDSVTKFCAVIVTAENSAVPMGTKIRLPAETLQEMARHATQAVLAIKDTREWDAVRVDRLQAGDMFVRYQIVGGVGVDEEVMVVRVRGAQKFDERVIDVTGPTGKAEVTAHKDHALRIHRPKAPTMDEVRDALAGDL